METSEFKALKEKLFSAKKNGYDQLESAELQAMEEYCSNYKAFLDAGKTERLCAAESVRLAEAHGYRRYCRSLFCWYLYLYWYVWLYASPYRSGSLNLRCNCLIQ